jgi:hypothetical protein
VCAALSRRRAHSERGKALIVLKWFPWKATPKPDNDAPYHGTIEIMGRTREMAYLTWSSRHPIRSVELAAHLNIAAVITLEAMGKLRTDEEMFVTVARLEAEVKAIALRNTMPCDSNPLHPDRKGQA